MDNKRPNTPFPRFFCEPHSLTGKTAENILVALSGGADSTLLLTLLKTYADENNVKLFAAHVNHNIRTSEYGNEAMRDEQFCRDLCQRLEVELFVQSADLPKMAKERGESLEAVAREVRYDFFEKIMAEHGISLLATAHNANDNLETQIFNLVRGCGIDGISGIPPLRKFRGGRIVRPLISATKAEILGYCAEHNIEYVTDSTNFIADCTRNKIRLEIIPKLEEISPAPQLSGIRLSESARGDADFLSRCAEDFVRRNVCGGKCRLSALEDLHPAIFSRVMKVMYKSAAGEQSMLEKTHIDALASLCKEKVPGNRLSLPRRITGRIDEEGNLIFIPENDVDATAPQPYKIRLSHGVNMIPNTPFAVLVQSSEQNDTPDIPEYNFLTSAELYLPMPNALFATSRKEGSRITDGGVQKKAKKLMCDKKIPLSWRASLPNITASDGELIYLPLCAVCDRGKRQNSENTDAFVRICIYIKGNISGGRSYED